MIYRNGHESDVEQIRALVLKSWKQFKSELTEEHWEKLWKALTNEDLYIELIRKSYSLLCQDRRRGIVGVIFLVPNGNPTNIFMPEWCYIRMLTVDPDFGGVGIGKELTKQCIEFAKRNDEKVIALHTSSLMKSARHIYESMGFTVLKELDNMYGKRYWLYTLDLKN